VTAALLRARGSVTQEIPRTEGLKDERAILLTLSMNGLGYEYFRLVTSHRHPATLESKKVLMKPVTPVLVATTLLALCLVMFSEQILSGSMLIAHIEGKVYVNEQRVEPSSAPIHMYNESVVRTEDGRAEIHLSGGISLFLGEGAAVKRVPSSTSRFSGVEMLRGSAVVRTCEMGVVATCSNEVTLSDSGLYRFDVIPLPELPGEKLCGLRVYEGAAAVKLATVISALAPGKFLSLNLACGDRTPVQIFDPKHADALDDWSRQGIGLRRVQ